MLTTDLIIVLAVLAVAGLYIRGRSRRRHH